MLDLNTIYQKYSTPEGAGDKGTAHSYIEIYDSYFSNRRNNIHLLEIGVNRGHSLKLWSEYFINSQIIGIDIDKRLLAFPENGFRVLECDATNQFDLESALAGLSFDFIIDDGSHKIEDQITTFNILFPFLKSDGIYFIEDIMNIQNNTLKLLQLNPNIEILDRRYIKNRQDDVIAIIKK